MPKLFILGAAYGLQNVTGKVASLAVAQNSNGELTIAVTSATLGIDPGSSVGKSLVVVYHYDKYFPAVAVQAEGGIVLLSPANYISHQLPPRNTNSSDLWIWGACYGLIDVTPAVTNLIGRDGKLTVTANNQTFHDCWPNVVKTLVVVYGKFATTYPPYPLPGSSSVEIITEGQSLTLQLYNSSTPPIQLLMP